jgi:F-type H+-transporting ATPase subunit epsilon
MLKVSVISPERTLFEGEARAVVAPAYDGEVGILTGHAPMMTLLGRGTLRLSGGGAEQRFRVEGGFLQVVDDQVRVVTERAAEASEGAGA